MNSEPADFVKANTVIDRPGLTPEIGLHLASEVTPLWHATEDTLAQSETEPPFWAFAWPGGQALARYVMDHPETVRGRHVLDIATGSGLVAIAAAKAGAASVTANDIDPLSLTAVTLNAALNGVNVTTDGRDLTGLSVVEEWDVILAGDIFYDREMAGQFTPWLREYASAGLLVLIGDPDRAYLPLEKLERVASYDVATSLDLEKSAVLASTVWQVSG